jgi:hypothetical protein
VNGNGFHVTDFGAPASGPVFEATHVAGDVDGELISVLRVLTGGVGAVRWSSVDGETVLERPRETVSHTVHGMDAAGALLVGQARYDGRLAAPVATVWDAGGDVTLLAVEREVASSARAVSPDGTLVAGVLLDLFSDAEPRDQNVLWDATNPDRLPVAIRTLFGGRTDAGVNAGPTAVTQTGLVAGWDTEGAFVWRSSWPSAISFRAYLAAAGLSLPSGERDELKGAVDVVGGTVFAGTTRQGSGDRVSAAHWVAFVPDTVTLPAPR